MKVVKNNITIDNIESIEQLREVLDTIADKPVKTPVTFDRLMTTLGKLKISTLRHATIGDVFKFKKPPPGWTSGAILVVDKMPGHAAPEGMDYLPIDLLEGEIEWIEGPHCEIKGQCQDLDGSGACKGCGRWLGDEETPAGPEISRGEDQNPAPITSQVVTPEWACPKCGSNSQVRSTGACSTCGWY